MVFCLRLDAWYIPPPWSFIAPPRGEAAIASVGRSSLNRPSAGNLSARAYGVNPVQLAGSCGGARSAPPIAAEPAFAESL